MTSTAVPKKSGGPNHNKQQGNPFYGLAELKGNVYRLSAVGGQADKYVKTTKAIAEYVGREYGQEMRLLVLKRMDGAPSKPEYPPGTTVT